MPKSKRANRPDAKAAALYVRVAHANEDAALCQEESLRQYAEEHGHRDMLTYVDNGISGIGFDRPALNRLQEDVAAGRISTVIVRDLSRLGRSFLELPDWINEIRHKGVSFISIMDGTTDEFFGSVSIRAINGQRYTAMQIKRCPQKRPNRNCDGSGNYWSVMPMNVTWN